MKTTYPIGNSTGNELEAGKPASFHFSENKLLPDDDRDANNLPLLERGIPLSKNCGLFTLNHSFVSFRTSEGRDKSLKPLMAKTSKRLIA